MNDRYRVEHDSLGEVEVPADALWGAQTERSRRNFPIGTQRFPPHFIAAFALVKKACALANASRWAWVVASFLASVSAGQPARRPSSAIQSPS